MIKTTKIKKVLRFGIIIYFCFLNYMLLAPQPWLWFDFIPGQIKTFSLLHMTIYGFLTFGVELLRQRHSCLFWYVFFVLWGILSEFLQPLTGRCFEIIDIIQNTIGVTAGVGLGYLAKLWYRRLRLYCLSFVNK